MTLNERIDAEIEAFFLRKGIDLDSLASQAAVTEDTQPMDPVVEAIQEDGDA